MGCNGSKAAKEPKKADATTTASDDKALPTLPIAQGSDGQEVKPPASTGAPAEAGTKAPEANGSAEEDWLKVGVTVCITLESSPFNSMSGRITRKVENAGCGALMIEFDGTGERFFYKRDLKPVEEAAQSTPEATVPVITAADIVEQVGPSEAIPQLQVKPAAASDNAAPTGLFSFLRCCPAVQEDQA